MDLTCNQTIAALSSPIGQSRQSNIRVSGPDSRDVVRQVFDANAQPQHPVAAHPVREVGGLQLRQVSHPIPASVYCWPTSRSYTGQPMCEIRLPGVPAFVDATLEGLYSAGAQPARAGEFTLRAFLAGRIDLLQAEAVLGVIDASDECHLMSALGQLAGGLSSAFAELHEQLLTDLSDLEAGLDFADEDIDFVDRSRMRARLQHVRSMLKSLADQAENRHHVRPVFRVVLAGLPNAGKSSLFNSLIEHDTAIVSDHGGTTRDCLTARLRWAGHDIELVDTPGCEESPDEVMQSASEMREAAVCDADVVVWCRAADLPESSDPQDRQGLDQARRHAARAIAVMTKADLIRQPVNHPELSVSTNSREGLQQLRRTILSGLSQEVASPRELIGPTAARCSDSIRRASEAVSRALWATENNGGDELIAAELREAVDEIGRVTGRTHCEDILDRIFSRFCIGK